MQNIPYWENSTDRGGGVSESIRMVVMCGAALRSVDATDSEATLHALPVQNSSSNEAEKSLWSK